LTAHPFDKFVEENLQDNKEKTMTHTVRGSSAEKSAKRGFTLIELLVVIAIIAILAAILFPVFARARENARRASCQSNLKQIGLGLMQYLQDYDEAMPFAPTGPGNGGHDWTVDVMPYLKSQEIFNCPSGGKNRDGNPIPKYPTASSYALNVGNGASEFGYPAGPTSRDGDFFGWGTGTILLIKSSQIAKPAQTVWAADGGGSGLGSSGRALGYWGADFVDAGDPANPLSIPWFGDRGQPNCFWPANHLNTGNILYCDGHVKAEQFGRLFAGSTPAERIRAITIADD
jgi:prepilin-type N-terminal cleavage/methylation domain-containing protein/prepilin-type processing-associated H-X9-DG protein